MAGPEVVSSVSYWAPHHRLSPLYPKYSYLNYSGMGQAFWHYVRRFAPSAVELEVLQIVLKGLHCRPVVQEVQVHHQKPQV
jgi:hypothetical protein